MLKPANTSAVFLSIVANGTDTQTANSALVTTNQLTLLSATAGGSFDIGPATGPGTAAGAYHTFYGSLRGQAGYSYKAVFGGSLEAYITGNQYRDGAGTPKAMAAGGMSQFAVYAQTVSTNDAFEYLVNTTNQTADTALTGTNVVISRLTAAGRWFWGNPALGTTQHAVYGSMESVVSPSLGYSLLARTFSALSVAGDSLDAVQIYNTTTFYGALGVAKTTNTTNQAGYIVLKSNNGTLYYMWFDDTGRLRVSSTQSHTGGQATGTVVGTQT